MNLKEKLNEIKIPAIASLVTMASVVPAFAEGTVTSGTEYQTVVTALTGAVSVSDIATIVGGTITVGMGFFLFWFGARKAVRAFTAALSKGKIKM